MVSTQKVIKTFSKILVSFSPTRGPKFKKYTIFLIKMIIFLFQFFYMQLLGCHAIYHLKELFTLKKIAYYLSIYVHIYLVKLLAIKDCPCLTTCREDING